MTCVLSGTNVRARQCQGALPGLRNKVLTTATRRENCRGHVVNRKSWKTLFTANANSKTHKNSWRSWYHKGLKNYDSVKVDKLEFKCGSTFVSYNLSSGTKGKTLL